jgi:hypothetical protein
MRADELLHLVRQDDAVLGDDLLEGEGCQRFGSAITVPGCLTTSGRFTAT